MPIWLRYFLSPSTACWMMKLKGAWIMRRAESRQAFWKKELMVPVLSQAGWNELTWSSFRSFSIRFKIWVSRWLFDFSSSSVMFGGTLVG